MTGESAEPAGSGYVKHLGISYKITPIRILYDK